MTAGSGLPEVSHLPFMVDRPGSDPRTGAGGRLIGHVDRRNAQWQDLQAHPGCLVTFLGPQAHVSPSWYGTRATCPDLGCTSRCMCGGGASLVTDHGALRDMVERLSEELEPEGSGWDPGQIVPYTERLMQYIVGFSIEIERIDTQVRLGQANTPEDRRRVLAALSNGSSSAQQVAALIRRLG